MNWSLWLLPSTELSWHCFSSGSPLKSSSWRCFFWAWTTALHAHSWITLATCNRKTQVHGHCPFQRPCSCRSVCRSSTFTDALCLWPTVALAVSSHTQDAVCLWPMVALAMSSHTSFALFPHFSLSCQSPLNYFSLPSILLPSSFSD